MFRTTFFGRVGLRAMMKTWRGFWRMDGSSRPLALESAAALVATWIGLRLAGLRRWKAVLLSLTPRAADSAGPSDPAVIANAQVITHIQQITAGHLIFQTSCLEQSLVLWWLLRRRRIAAELRIGGRKEEGRFEAHAWVELGSVVLNDSGEEHLHFTPFDGPVISAETQTH
jgi:hypothetical protein